MLNQEQQLAIFVEAINQNADKICKRIQKDNNKYFTSMAKQLDEEASNIKNEKVNYYTTLLNKELNKKIAQYKKKSLEEIIRKREDICCKVFDLVAVKLINFTKSDEYISYIENSINCILDITKEHKVVVSCKKDDCDLIKSLCENHFENFDLQINNEINIGGIKALCSDINKSFDDTLDSSLFEQIENFRQMSKMNIILRGDVCNG